MSETKTPNDNTQERPPFPAWLRELCYFGGIIVTLTLFLFTLKSDQRSTSEKLDRVAEDLSTFSQRLTTIEARLPNKEAEGLRYQVLEQKVAKDRSDWEFAVAKLEKWKEDTTRSLIKKGVID